MRSLEDLRRECLKRGLDVSEPPPPELARSPSAYFLSGSSMTAEIRGIRAAGRSVGVTAPNLSKNAEAELVDGSQPDEVAFVDSGAFSEVIFDGGAWVVSKPIEPLDWARILDLYERLVSSFRGQVSLVAPDRVGCQTETLARLVTHRARLERLAGDGGRVLVPLQKGKDSLAAFYSRVESAIGPAWWSPAFPFKKNATSILELETFLAERSPKDAHVLGVGLRSRLLPALARSFDKAGLDYTIDSCWITGNVGTSNGPGGGARRYTRARWMAKKVLGVSVSPRVTELALYCCLVEPDCSCCGQPYTPGQPGACCGA